jgi:dTDP-glucose pyrophosphorylase
MLNIVLPIAGRGSRFAVAGYDLPKPLIPVHGIPMIALVAANVRPTRDHRFIFVAQQEHLDHTDMRDVLERHAPGCAIVGIDGVTEGAACTVLAARALIDNEHPLMLANSDQYVDADIDAYLATLDDTTADGLIMTFPADHPKWSYVRRNAEHAVVEVVEKQVVSHEATVGIYNFRRGCDFIAGADRMIARDRRVNGEFYVAPVYNEMIEDGARVVTHDIGPRMHGLGVPEDLQTFLSLDWTQARARAA